MNDLVKAAIAAHGGLERWQHVERISANFHASGMGFKQRGPVAMAFTEQPTRATIHTPEQKVTFDPYIAPGHKGIYLPDRTAVEAADGTIVQALDNPRRALENLVPGTAWTETQILYFLGYSLWMYFTLPYNFLMDGVQCEEVAPWVENGEMWRGLKVTYPASFPSHSTEQIHYFDQRGAMRRQDYTVDVRQGLSATHYIDGHREVDGLLLATQRRIYLRGQDGKPEIDKLLISANFDQFEIIKSVS